MISSKFALAGEDANADPAIKDYYPIPKAG